MKCRICEYEAEFDYRFVPAETDCEGSVREAALWRYCARCGYGFIQQIFKDLRNRLPDT